MVQGVTPAQQLAQDFVQFSLQSQVLRFGEFKTKAGRLSPYFFNAGLFDDGAKLAQLAAFYADKVMLSGIDFDVVLGPAYKGIPLGAALAVELARRGRNVPFAYNRKEAKQHGEGGVLVGAPLRGRVLIVDDVISAGTAVRDTVALIQAAGAQPHAVLIALDRQERATHVDAQGQLQDLPYSAVQHVQQSLGLQVCAVAGLSDVWDYLQRSADPLHLPHLDKIHAYRQRYGST